MKNQTIKTSYKSLFLILWTVCLYGTDSNASDRPAGSAGVWVCRDGGFSNKVRWTRAADLFETAENERFPLEEFSGSHEDIVDEVRGRIERALPKLAREMATTFREINYLKSDRSKVSDVRGALDWISGATPTHAPNPDQCHDGRLETDPTTGSRIIPFLSVANFKSDGTIEVQRQLFKESDETTKASIVIRAVVESYLRARPDRTRQDANAKAPTPSPRIVALLFSKLSEEEIGTRIRGLLNGETETPPSPPTPEIQATESPQPQTPISEDDYLTQFPSIGIKNVIVASGWYDAAANGNGLALREVRSLLSESLSVGRMKAVEQLIEFEEKHGCGQNRDYLKRKEVHIQSGSASYSSRTAESGSKTSRASGSLTSASASSRFQSTSFESGSSNYYDNYRLEEREVYCDQPKRLIRAVIRATARIKVVSPDDRKFLINRHIVETFRGLELAVSRLLRGTDSVILSPYLTPQTLETEFEIKGPGSLFAWFSNGLSSTEVGRKYIDLVRRLSTSHEYEAAATNYISLVSSVAQRLSQVEPPGLVAAILNSSGQAQRVQLLDVSQLRRLDPRAKFSGTTKNASVISSDYLDGISKDARCERNYFAMLESARRDPFGPIISSDKYLHGREFYSEARTEQANLVLSCSDRYRLMTTEFEVRGEYRNFQEVGARRMAPLKSAFENQGCIPFANRKSKTSYDFEYHTIHFVCPLR